MTLKCTVEDGIIHTFSPLEGSKLFNLTEMPLLLSNPVYCMVNEYIIMAVMQYTFPEYTSDLLLLPQPQFHTLQTSQLQLVV